jgi:hypothetical protein
VGLARITINLTHKLLYYFLSLVSKRFATNLHPNRKPTSSSTRGGFMASGCCQTGRVLAIFLSTCFFITVVAQPVQKTLDRVQEDGGFRLVTREEGDAIVQVAWELRRGFDSKPDCSHFVNAVYVQAGLDYEYARTQDIFDGIDSFRRVYKPQPGDLVVWHGHVGIVVDPDEHSFYSSVLSGFAIEDYRSTYWANRGQPRFYRYLIDDVHKARMVAHLNASQSTARVSSVDAALPEVNSAPPRSRARPARDVDAIIQPTSGDSKTSDIVFVSSHTRPSKDDVRAALIRFADANGERLSQHAVIRPEQSIVIPDQVMVADVDVNDRSGWVALQMKDQVRNGSGPDGLTVAGRWRLSLQRENRGWVMLVPQDRIYLRLGPAIHALADQVARTSRVPANEREFKKAVKTLNDLLSRDAADATAGLH